MKVYVRVLMARNSRIHKEQKLQSFLCYKGLFNETKTYTQNRRKTEFVFYFIK